MNRETAGLGFVFFLSISVISFRDASATGRRIYVDPALSSDCLNGNYSYARRDCSGNDGNAYKNLFSVTGHYSQTERVYVPGIDLQSGDEVILRGGNYRRPRPSGWTNNTAAFTVHAHGEPGLPIVFRGAEGERAILDGTVAGAKPWCKAFWIQSQNVQLENLEFTGGEFAGLCISESQDIAVRGCRSYRNTGQQGCFGFYAYAAERIEFDGVYGFLNGGGIKKNGLGIMLGTDNPGTACEDCLVENSFFFQNIFEPGPPNDPGTDSADGGSVKGATSAIFRNNLFYLNWDDGLDTLGCVDCELEDNLFLMNVCNGAKLNVGGGGASSMHNNITAFNGADGITTGRTVASILLQNTAVQNGGIGITVDPGSRDIMLSGNISANNVGRSNATNIFCSFRDTLLYSDWNLFASAADISRMRQRGFDSNSLSSDPAFIDSDLGFARPKPMPEGIPSGLPYDRNLDGVVEPEELFFGADYDGNGKVEAKEALHWIKGKLGLSSRSPAIDRGLDHEPFRDLIVSNLARILQHAVELRENYRNDPGQQRRFRNYGALVELLEGRVFLYWMNLGDSDGCGAPAQDGDGDGVARWDLGSFEFTGQGGSGEDCLKGDVNGDGRVDREDIQAFIEALLQQGFGARNLCAADMNGDGVVDGFDIEPFVALLGL